MKVVKIIFVSILFSFWSNAQINFSQSQITFNVPGNPGAAVNAVTSLMYGPDGRLYVAEYTGAIKILTIQRNSPTDYVVTDIEELDGILTMEDHNDDGTTHNSTFRETIGLTVVGTAQNPIIYVTSSDFRIGAGDGGGNGDVDLDTNSGVITRFSWNGTSWDVVDLVRGLPRSEENHATNGLEFVTIGGTDYLIVASGGHTNAGSPSTNFVYTCEYALSAAVLAVDLTALNSLPILDDNGRKYIYDLPTLDDPTRPNVNGITDPDVAGYDGVDINDPFGGNDGLNQAIVDPNGPVQIFSPGYRNAYDLVVTEDGAVYVTDNGANGGWGGFPDNEGGGNATNDYDANEPGSTSSSGGEQINNKDHLQLVTTNIQNYTFGSLYGGHPNPTRANPTGAGLYTDDGTNQVFRTLIYDPGNPGNGYTANPDIALPANWNMVVPTANPVEGDWRGPGISNPDGPNDNPVTTWGTNTNGIDEYTATNFGGIMQGNLIAGVNSGILRRVELDSNGNLDQLTSNFLSGIGGNALGVTCNGDNEIFPGTIWAGTLNGKIVVFEPQDFVPCLDPNDESYDPLADYDNDGYTNQDEEQNFTDACNGGSQPADFDKSSGGTLISDLNDTDDDFDGIPDSLDPFQLGDHTQSGSDAFTLPINNDLFNDQQGLGGIFGLGMTGLMNNGDVGANWLNWIDDRDNGPNPNDVLGGAPGIMTSHMTSGTALGTINSQEKGYQYGVQVDNSTGSFTITGGMNGFTGPLRLFENEQGVTNGELGFFIGDGTQSNYIKFVVTTDGFTALQEIDDVPQASVNFTFPTENLSISGILFHFVVNNLTGEVNLEYQTNGGSRTLLGTITAQGNILTALQDPLVDLAVGFIGTSGTAGLELEGSWDFLNVSPYPLIEVDPITNQNNDVNDEISPFGVTATGGNPSANFTYLISGQPEGINIDSSTGIISGAISANAVFGGPNEDGFHDVMVTVNKPGSTQQIINFNWTVTGPLVMTSIDDQQDQIGTTVSLQALASGGDTNEPLVFSISGQPSGLAIDSSTGEISGTIDALALIGGPNSDGVHSVTVTTSRLGSADAITNFTWTVTDVPLALFRINAGGPELTYNSEVFSADANFIGGKTFENTSANVSPLFQTERSANPPTFEYAFSVPNGDYEVVLHFAEIYFGATGGGSGSIGDRVFDVAGEGVTLLDDYDIYADVGPQTEVSKTFTVSVSDGELNLLFDAEGADGVDEPKVSAIEVYSLVQYPAISVDAIADQDNLVGDEISTLGVSASGGNPTANFTYGISGEPDGIFIEPTNGLIYGTISSEAVTGGPNNDGLHQVMVTVSKLGSESVEINFNWTVTGPLVMTSIDDQQDQIGTTVSLQVLASGGDTNEPLVFSISGQPSGLSIDSSTGEISGTIDALALIGGPNSDGVHSVTVTTSRLGSADAITNFTWTVTDVPLALFRINAGGPELTYNSEIFSADANFIGGKTFENTSATVSPLFQTERSANPPTFEYAFSVPNGDYEVVLHFAEIFFGATGGGSGGIGDRVFDVEGEGVTLLDDYDIYADVGPQTEVSKTFMVSVSDGELNLLFDAGGADGVDEPKVSAIEVYSLVQYPAISVDAIADQDNEAGDEISTLSVTASGGSPTVSFTYAITGQPEGIDIDTSTGVISGTVSANAVIGGPNNDGLHQVTVTVSKPGSDPVDINFNWTVTGPLLVTSIDDQQDQIGTTVSLQVLASGGDTNEPLVFSISGQPSGLSIDSSTGEISGTIDALALIGGPNSDGVHSVTVTTSRLGSADAITNFTWTVTDVPLALFRINAGGPELTYNSEIFSADANFIGGKTFENTSATVSPLFQTERSANPPTFEYAFSVPNGDYEVVLHFAEIFFGATGGGSGGIGDRVFDVEGEGVTLLDDYDIYADVGPQTEVSKTFMVSVSDGELNLLFDAGGADGVDEPKVSAIEVYSLVQYPAISVDAIADQDNEAGDEISTLSVTASGGSPTVSFTYAITGQPEGIDIDTSTGVISGTVSANAVIGGPNNDGLHQVTVTVSKPGSDPVDINFNWTVTGPLLVTSIDDQQDQIGTTVSLQVLASGGDTNEPLVFSISGQPSGLSIDSSTGEISGTIDALALIGGPNSDGVHSVTVTTSRLGSADAITNFTWTVTDVPLALFRINAGGPELTYNSEIFSADANFIGGKTFENTSATVSPLFQTERSANPPTFEYAFSVPNGDYEVVLHFAEIFFGATGGGSGGIGDRVFDVEGEGVTLLDDYDIYADVGPQTEVSKTFMVSVSDGELNLLFDAGGADGVDEPKVSAIEVYSLVQYPAISVDAIADQDNEAGDEISTLSVTASGGSPTVSFTYAITGQPEGIDIDTSTGVISGTVSANAVIGGPNNDGLHQVTVTVSQPGSDPVDTSFSWTITGPQLPFTLDTIEDQQDTIGDFVSLQSNATGGDTSQPIVYSILGQPLGLNIDTATGEISGIIDIDAHTGGTNSDGIYQVTVTADRLGSPSVQQQFVWNINNISCAWNDLADANISRFQSRNAIVGDKLYVMGGWLQGINASDDLDIYDITNDTWSLGSNLPEPLTHMGIITTDEEIWLIGGWLGDYNATLSQTDKVRIYNTITNSWSDGPDLPKAIGSCSATINNNVIHLIGGLEADLQTDISDHYVLDLNNINAGWTTAAPLPRPRNHHSVQSLNGLIYVVGGQEGHEGSVSRTDYVDVYDPSTDSWAILADLPTTRSHVEPGTLVHNNKIIIVGGREDNIISDEVTQYDPLTNEWTDLCNLPNNRMAPVAKVYQNQLIVSSGGINGTSNLVPTTQYLQLAPSTVISVNRLANQVNQSSDDIGTIPVVALGGSPNLDFSYSIIGQPDGVVINSTTGEISGTVDSTALLGGPNSDGLHFVTVTVSKLGTNDEQINFTWNITDVVWQVKGEVENYSERHECSFLHVGDGFALIGGRETNDVDIFDYNLGVWNPAVSTAPNTLNHFQGVYYQGYVWAIGAFDGGNSVFPNDPIADHVWLFDTNTNQWIEGPEIPIARQRGSTGLVMYNNKFYLIGGNTLGHSGGYVPWFDEYDPKTGVWTTLTDAPNARDHFQATLVGDKIYVIGGAQTDQPSSSYVEEVDVYDFVLGTWTTLIDKELPTPRDGASIAIFNNDIIVMGGGDEDQSLGGGVFVKGTREITEGFDIETETWYKMPDMNFGHRSTQAIVSGNGIHILAGLTSSGGPQNNMEYYGEDNPTGTTIIASQLSVPNLITVASDGNSDFNIEALGGDTGIFITSMEIIGTNASDFSISSGEIIDGLLVSGASHAINIALNGTGDNRTASLIINYGNAQTAIVNLSNSPLTNPGDQSNFLGDSVSLQIDVADNNGTYSFTASELPEGLTIDNSTGLISGTVTGSLINSPYTTRVAIEDISTSLEVSYVNFQWEVLDPTILILEDIPEQSNLVGDTVMFSASAIGGDEAFPMVYTINGQPQGVSIDNSTGAISGTIDLLAELGGPNNDGIYLVFVTASRQGSSDVQIQFSWIVSNITTDLPWVEDFEDLVDGSTIDTGDTAWSTSIDQGAWDVQGGILLLSPASNGSTAVWSSEPIDITGHENVTISIDVDDLDNSKENSDYVDAFYRLDGGSLIPFGTVTGNIDLTTFTVSGITGSVLELVVETQVSFTGEIYSIDNINVSGTPTVPIAVSSVTLSPSALSVEIGDNSQQLTATVNPSNADDTSVSWLSSDESVATVDENGFITPVAVGEATITVTTTDGGFQDTSIVTVIEEVIVPVTGITLSPSDATMNIGGATLLLEATILPFDASDQGVTWSTSDAGLASVDSNGEVTANSEGVAVITATTSDGGFVASSTINVIVTPTDLPWVEDFEDLVDGSTIDTGDTAWSTSIDQGAWDVQGGILLLSPASNGSTAVWSSEPIDITGHENVTISIDVDDLDNSKENSDYVDAFYRLDGGSLIPFGTVTGNIDLTTFTVSGITGSVLELVVETQVSFTGEIYSIDNINVSGTPTVPIAVSSVTLSPSALSVEIGDNSQQLTATVNPSNADDTSVSWLSSDESVATVDENGFITPVAVGEATITVTTTDGGFQDTSIVTVIEEVIVPVTGITLSPSDATMNIGGATLLLEATILPFDASDQGVTWSTSDAGLASVDSNGEVTANSEGVAVITATTSDGGFVASSTINVIVTPTDLPWVEDFEDLVDGSTIDTGDTAWSTSIDQGAWDVQGGILLLSPASNGSTAVWSSEPIDITGHENVTISIDVDDLDNSKENSDYVDAFYRLDGGSLIPFGTVTGNIDLTTFTVSGITGSVLELVVETQVSFTGEIYSIDNINVSGTPTVPIAVSSVTLSPSALSVEIGDNSQQLTATVNPSNADDTSVSWLSSDESVATVDENGFITPVAVGEATITVTTTDGGFQDTSIVTVIEEVIVPVTGITLSPSDATMNIGGATLLLEATILPFDASDQGVTWSTSDAGVASVDSNGEVTANSEGVAVITATTSDGGFVASSTINVIVTPTDLPWVEDFEDLVDGSTIDTGDTAWSTSIDQGAWDVQGGILLLSPASNGSTAVWSSEPIDITGHENVTISIDVDDLDNSKENSDYVDAFYRLDGGSLIPFGSVTGNIDLTTFTVSGITGSVLELVVETQVSFLGEIYRIDNVNVIEPQAKTENPTTIYDQGNDNIFTDDFVIYPNPTSGILNISSRTNNVIDLIRIFDATGREVRTYDKSKINKEATYNHISLDGLQLGIYTIQITDNQNNRVIKKLIVK